MSCNAKLILSAKDIKYNQNDLLNIFHLMNQDMLSHGNFKLDNKSLMKKSATDQEQYEMDMRVAF